MAPQPPVPDDTVAAVRVTARQFGETWTDPNGNEAAAGHDGVLIEFIVQDRPVASIFQTPQAALQVGQMLATAASDAVNNQITDDGRPLPLRDRLHQLLNGGNQ